MFSITPRNASSVARSSDPFTLMDALMSDWFSNRTAPALVSRARLEVSEREGRYEVRAELPGATKENIQVDIDGAWVSISARADARNERKEGEKLLYTERSHESYARSFELPHAVDSASATAKFENGVLTLTLPKKDAPRSARLAVQ